MIGIHIVRLKIVHEDSSEILINDIGLKHLKNIIYEWTGQFHLRTISH